MFSLRKPEISALVLAHGSHGERRRTLHSLCAAYQNNIKLGDYEVIVVESPSSEMLPPNEVSSFGRNFRHVVKPLGVSTPAAATNFAASLARGRQLMLLIGGAPILSPGVLWRSMAATRLYDRSVVMTLRWRLGLDAVSQSLDQAHCSDTQNQLLDSVDWRNNGYRLFEISSLLESGPTQELVSSPDSHYLTIDRQYYESLGGFSEHFRTGRGQEEHRAFFRRAVADDSRQTVLLLGEGAFLQNPNPSASANDRPEPHREFAAVSSSHLHSAGRPVLFGHMPAAAKRLMEPILFALGSGEQRPVAPHAADLVPITPETTTAPHHSGEDPLRKVA